MTQSMIPNNLTDMAKSGQKLPQEAAHGAVNEKAKASITTILNGILDGEGYRKRLEELLGARTPQFISSIITLVNADQNLKQAAVEAPGTIIQSALKAAVFDLPIDPGLGYAYIVPFNNLKEGRKVHEAAFILGYKGMIQMALRSGVYKRINVVELREGELVRYDRLTEDIEIDWIEDEEERDKLPIIGWVGYYRMINGTEKTIYMSRAQVEAHERKNRKGQFMGKGWREDFDAMAAKTVIRRLIGKYGIMSIDYRSNPDPEVVQIAEQAAKGSFDELGPEIETEGSVE